MTKTDELLAAAAFVAFAVAIYGFLGVTGFAVIGAVIAGVALVAVLCWLNDLTGGLVGFLLAVFAIFG